MAIYHNRIKEIKELGPVDFIKVKIGGTFASLRPVDESDETVYLLTEWRKKYWNWFSSKFEITEDRTRKWLRNEVIDNPDKILFIIFLENKKIGQCGMFRYNVIDNSAEMDNVLRGVRDGYSGLMEKVGKTVLKWGFEDLNLSKVQLRVFSDNYKAINLYERCEMLTVGTIPLKRIFTQNGWSWEETQLQSENDYPERYFNIMEITKENYLKQKNFEL
jgi:RimJ/RimL family protein N-acetyltransferase